MHRIALALVFATVFAGAAAAQTPPAPANTATADSGDNLTDRGRASAVTGAANTDNGHAAATSAVAGTTNKRPDPNAQHTIAPEVAVRADGDEIVCKAQPVIGSRLTSRMCLPRRRWAQMHQDGQDFIRNIDERSSGGQVRRF